MMGAEEFKGKWLPLSGRFYRVAYYILESSQDAEDAVQDLYARLWKNRDSLVSIGNPVSYGITVIRNICLDKVRHATVSKVVRPSAPVMESQVDPDADPERQVSGREEMTLLRSCMARLPSGQSKILRMRIFEDRPIREISETLGMSEVNVRVHLSNARKNLKKMMRDEKRR